MLCAVMSFSEPQHMSQSAAIARRTLHSFAEFCFGHDADAAVQHECNLSDATSCLDRRLSATQFERTLIVAEDDAYVSYLEGCTAPSFDENQLHAAVVELSAGANAEIKYSTVQNWCGIGLYPP